MNEELREEWMSRLLRFKELREDFESGKIFFMSFLDEYTKAIDEMIVLLEQVEFMNKH